MFCQVRKFFEVEGNQVTEEEEFLHYYALPFVREPANHPTFNTLFQVGREREGGTVGSSFIVQVEGGRAVSSLLFR